MKLLLLSDTHGYIAPILEIIRTEKPDYVFHMGDYARDVLVAEKNVPLLPNAAVKGNCDLGSDSPEKRIFELGGKKFFMTHGHIYGVKAGLDRLALNAKCAGADIVLFGHTHVPVYENLEGIIFINPGSLRYGGSYGILDVAGDDMNYFPREYRG